MSELPIQQGGLRVLSGIVPASSASTYGTHYSYLGVGGYVEVPNIDYRNSIPPDSNMNDEGYSTGRRRYGMMVYVIDEDKLYRLFPFSGGSVVSLETFTGTSELNQVTMLSENDGWVEVPDLSVLITGGTYFSGSSSIVLYDSTGGTVSITGITTTDVVNPGDGRVLVSTGNSENTFVAQSNMVFNGTNLSISGGTFITDSGGSLHPSAIVQFKSTTKGVLFPVLTTVEKNAILNPTSGLTVFDSTIDDISVYTSSGWTGVIAERDNLQRVTERGNSTNTGLRISGTTYIVGSGSTNGNTFVTSNSTNTQTFTIKDNGNVLIGTTTDTGYKLDVNGRGHFTNGLVLEQLGYAGFINNGIYSSMGYNTNPENNNTVLKIGFGAGTSVTTLLKLDNSTNVTQPFGGSTVLLDLIANPSQTNNIIQWRNSSGVVLGVVNNLGHIGIGTTGSTEQRLFVSGSTLFRSTGTTSGSTAFSVQNSTGGTLLNLFSNGNLNIDSGVLYVDGDNGRVGIGTTSPTYKLQVGDFAINSSNKIVIATANAGVNGFYVYAGASNYVRTAIEHDYGTSLTRFMGSYNTGTNIIGQDGNNGHTILYSGPSSSERVRVVGSNGNVLIGTTTDAGYKLDVNGSANFSNNVVVTTASSGTVQLGNSTTSIFRIVNTYERINVQPISIGGTINLNAGTEAGASYTLNDSGHVFAYPFNRTTANTFSINRPFFGNVVAGTKTMLSITTSNVSALSNATLLRGIYFNPTVTDWASVIAFENTAGNVILGSTSGNVMIGTSTDAGYRLDVSGTTRVNARFSITDGGSNERFIEVRRGSGWLCFGNTAGSESIAMNNGTLLIGVEPDSQTAKVQIQGTGSTSITKPFLIQNSLGTQLGYVDDSGQWQIGTGVNSGYRLELGSFNNGLKITSTNNSAYNAIVVNSDFVINGVGVVQLGRSTASTTFNASTHQFNIGSTSNRITTTTGGGFEQAFTFAGSYGQSRTFTVGSGLSKQGLWYDTGSALGIYRNTFPDTSSPVLIASTTGNVLIGTTTDANYILDVSGTTRIISTGSTSGSTTLTLQNSTGGTTTQFRSDGVIGISSATTFTTQVTSVISASTTNSGIAIVPNGTGAFTLNIPSGTVTGGDVRGQYAVDLQLVRGFSYEVASGTYSFAAGLGNQASGQSSIAMGERNSATGSKSTAIGGGGGAGGGVNATADFATAIGGYQNNASGQYSGVFGGAINTASSTNSVVLGGQSNVASTGTHATVIGGLSNTASGQYSIAGGQSNTSSGSHAVSFGGFSTASALQSFAVGTYATASGWRSFAQGQDVTASADFSMAKGYRATAYLYGQTSFANSSSAGYQQSYLTSWGSFALTSGSTVTLSLDGTGITNLIIPNGNNRAWNVVVNTITVCTVVSGGTLTVGDAHAGEYKFLFKRVGGTSTISPITTSSEVADTSMATASYSFSAGTSQQMAITFNAPNTANNSTFRAVAKVALTEVAW